RFKILREPNLRKKRTQEKFNFCLLFKQTWFQFTFGKRKINLMLNSQIIGYGSLHLEVKYLIVRDLVKDGSIMMEHIDTNSMVVDPLTKGLKHIVFKRCVQNINIVNYCDVLG
ncbi:hypothetical protein CR513_53032, partial [Mucuna pruriens]